MIATKEMITLHADFLIALIITCQKLQENESFKRISRSFTEEEKKEMDLKDYCFRVKDMEYVIPMDFIADLGSKLTFNVVSSFFELIDTSHIFYYEASNHNIHDTLSIPHFHSIFKKYIYIENDNIIFNGADLNLDNLLEELGYEGLNKKTIQQCIKVTNIYFDKGQNWGYQNFDKMSNEKKKLIRNNRYTFYHLH